MINDPSLTVFHFPFFCGCKITDVFRALNVRCFNLSMWGFHSNLYSEKNITLRSLLEKKKKDREEGEETPPPPPKPLKTWDCSTVWTSLPRTNAHTDRASMNPPCGWFLLLWLTGRPGADDACIFVDERLKLPRSMSDGVWIQSGRTPCFLGMGACLKRSVNQTETRRRHHPACLPQ